MARLAAFTVDDLGTAGLAVARRDGWAAVSQRSVAAELGVTPMALYRLAPDAVSLRRLIADRAAPPVAPPDAGAAGPDPVHLAAGDGPLAATLRRWAVAAYDRLGRYPLLASFVILEWTEMPAWLDVVEALLAHADAGGLAGADAVAVVNAVFAYTLARAQLRDAAATAPRRELAPLAAQPDRYPHVRANRPEFAVRRIDTHFTVGLNALLAGLPRR
jgi:hypothetical protein